MLESRHKAISYIAAPSKWRDRELAETLKDKACIVGVGETEYSKNSGRSEMRLALEVITAAYDDAGISPKDIAGFEPL